MSEFSKLISDHENVVEIPVNGVGTDINLIDRYLGGEQPVPCFRSRWHPTHHDACTGLGGWGTLRNVVTAHSK